MLRYLWRLLVVGFTDCEHTWDTVDEVLVVSPSNTNSLKRSIYTQKCSKCGEYKKTTIKY